MKDSLSKIRFWKNIPTSEKSQFTKFAIRGREIFNEKVQNLKENLININ
jgi:hypothetical protein